MLRRLQHHINVKIKVLLDKMILGTVLILFLALVLCLLYAYTHNITWLGILWLTGLIYAVAYFSDALEFGSIVRDLDQGSLDSSIWLSKAYLLH
jgi:hypothetical protein